MARLRWEKLLNEARFSDLDKKAKAAKKKSEPEKENKEPLPEWLLQNSRTEIERDYDRILFSSATRRLGDKTQVFPLDKDISIRNRLTHSHEVSNLARSIGTYLAYNHKPLIKEIGPSITRDLPSILAAIGLVHDLGNPPFGHQGEKAISYWVKKNQAAIFKGASFSNAQKNDFLAFEGNAQTLRLLTKIQVVDRPYGFNLTFATLAAVMKYTVPSNKSDGKTAARKKHGFFQSEQDTVKTIWEQTGLSEGLRHPLTYIMEACDDTAYSVIDAEDSVKKGLVSFADLIAWLEKAKIVKNEEGNETEDEVVKWVLAKSLQDHRKHLELKLSPLNWMISPLTNLEFMH